jgi:hypothetical protein
MLKDLYYSKKIVASLGMNYEKIDVCEKCILFWKEHKDDTKYMHYSRSRYVKVVNEDEVTIVVCEGGKRRWSLYYHNSDDQIALLYTYYGKAKMVVPIRRNNEANEVAQGRKKW